jgi:hypothetical protein
MQTRRPLFERIAGFEGRTNHTIGDELIEATSPTRFRCRAWGDELGDHAPVCRDRDALAGLNSPNIATEVVFQLAATFATSARLKQAYGSDGAKATARGGCRPFR